MNGRWPGSPTSWLSPIVPAAPGMFTSWTVLTIAPVTTRNAILEHDPVLISWNGGINLFMGNDAGFDQTSGQWHPDLAWMRLYYAPPLMGGTVRADHQRFFLHQTRLMFQAEPGAVIQRMCRKAALLLTDYEIPNNQRIDEARTYSPVLALLVWQGRWWGAPFGWAAPLIAVGLVFAWRRVPGGPLACCLLALSWAIVPVLFFNTARYRLPIVLLLLPVAAAGWVQWRRSRGLAAVVTGTIVVLVGSVTIPVDPRLPPSDALNLADVAEREGAPLFVAAKHDGLAQNFAAEHRPALQFSGGSGEVPDVAEKLAHCAGRYMSGGWGAIDYYQCATIVTRNTCAGGSLVSQGRRCSSTSSPVPGPVAANISTSQCEPPA